MAQPLRFQHFEVLTRPDGTPHLLGKGAMGLTYKAFDLNLLSLVVIKVMAPQHLGRPEARQRFLQEAQSMAKIKHPNVADVFFFGDSPQGVFYAMEFCDGPSMQEYVDERGPMAPPDALVLGLQAAQALEAVERHNLIHRDIKPSNLLLVNDVQGRSQIKLIDFGLARDVMRDARDPNLSQGGFVGTPTFASPEQLLEQDDLDIRSDIYSLGITLWFMLSGRPPFSGSQFEVMFHHVNTPPPWDRLPAMPPATLAVLRRMIEKSPDERFPTPGDLVRELQHAIDAAGPGAAGVARLQLGSREKSGSVLGMSSFEILSEADADPTGKMFRARDTHNGQTVVLKYLHPELVAKPTVLGKIQRLVLSLRSLEHPNLAGVLGFEKSEDGAKIIGEWVRGPSLLTVLKTRHHLTLTEAAPLLAQLASAFDFAAARGLGTLETDLHQILLTSPDWGEEPVAWAKFLRQPPDTWTNVTLKVNPLRLSLAAQDYPSLAPAAAGPPDGSKPLVHAFLQLTHRLLGGAAGSHASSGGGFVSIPGLGAEANDFLESFSVPPFTPEKRETTCAAVLIGLCQAEGMAPPTIYEPPVEPEEDLLKTRDASHGPSPVPGRMGSAVPRPPSLPGSSLPAESSAAGRSAVDRSHSPSRFASQGRTGTRLGTSSGSTAGKIAADYEIKRRELDLQRQRLEAETERLKHEEVLEATRAMLDEERGALAEAKDEFARQERERAQRAEQERRKLEEERQRLEAKTLEVEAKRREQERLEQEIQLRAQLEFQKFEDERRQREAEWSRQRDEIERSLKEREEQSFLREQQSFKKLRDERERLQTLQQELDRTKAASQQEAEAALRQQVAALEAERQSVADKQAELDRRLLAQSQEFARLRDQFDAAEREIDARHRRLAEEEAAAATRRQADLDVERQRLADERAQLEHQRSALAAERQAGTAATVSAAQQREENEAALARLAAEEARLAADRAALETQRSHRESELAAELARAKQELEAERAALAHEAERAKQTGLAQLEGERAAIAATRAQLATQEAALAAQVEEKGRALEAELARQRDELAADRASLDSQRERLDAEHRRLTDEFAREKQVFVRELEERRAEEEADHRRRMQERAEELSRLETEQQARLTALRREVSSEETRLRQQKEEVFTQERLITRMDQEASYQDEETLKHLEAEQRRLESQRGEIEQKLLELHRAQKKRLVSITAGIVLAIAAASVAGYYIKGRLLDPAKLKGQEAWVKFEEERKSTVSHHDWPTLLNWCVVTDDRFQNRETDPVIRNFYKEKRGGVLSDAGRAVSGLRADLDRGWKPPPPDDEAFKKLRQNLDVVAQWDGIPTERLLVLARLDLPYLTAQGNPGAALETYAATVKADPSFVPLLQKELSVTIQGLLDDFVQDHAVNRRDDLFDQLRKLPPEAQNSVPRTWLVLYLLKIEQARSSAPTVENFATALNALNGPATLDATKAFFAADPLWEKTLRPEIDRILDTIKAHPETINRLEEPLRETAEQWHVDRPYLMLAEAAPATQKRLDFYLAAEKLTGNPEARARVAGYYLAKVRTLRKDGQNEPAQRLMDEAMIRIKETAAAGQAEAMSLYSEILREGLAGEKDLDQAIAWAVKAREKGHADADFSLGLSFLEKAESSADPALLHQAESSFRAATRRPDSVNAAVAWNYLAQTYHALKDWPQMIDALENGTRAGDPNSMYLLGALQIGHPLAGIPKASMPPHNLTLGRDTLTAAARLNHAGAKAMLKTNAAEWAKSGLPADREWLRQNSDLLQN